MKLRIFLFSVLAFTYACSSSEKTSKNPSVKESYVFDDVSEKKETGETKIIKDEPITTKESVPEIFIVQLAAFTTEDRADKFIAENKNKLQFSLIKKYNEKVNLFVVQIPPFTSRDEADKVRNELWKIDAFKDAFITK